MPTPLLPKAKHEIVRVCRSTHARGWVANHDGNASLRLNGNRLLISCTAMSKGDLTESDLLVVDLEGRVLEGRRKPFSEIDLHLAIYRQRSDVDAVLHAHPPHAAAFGLVGLELAPIAMPEIVVSLGDRIPTLPRALPKSRDGIVALEAAIARHDAVLLSGNGAITVGSDLTTAFLRMELVEHYAHILAIARGLGSVHPLSTDAIETLLAARAKAGLGPKQLKP